MRDGRRPRRPEYGSSRTMREGRRPRRPDAPDHAVHPHVRGGNRGRDMSEVTMLGSPARAWGKRCCGVRQSAGGRFTRTCVGETAVHWSHASYRSVHPHVRGENVARSPNMCLASGSPPRAWGKRDQPGRAEALTRFTPTCVGKTPQACGFPSGSAVHPHVRGENAMDGVEGHNIRGSPPRAWGKLREGIMERRR